MPADDSPAILVARFLRANDYPETLAAFLDEAGLPPDAGTGSSKALTIEQVLQEKKAYDLSVNFEKLGVEEKATAWTKPAPSVSRLLRLPTATNLLCIAIESLRLSDDTSPEQILLVSTAERRLHMLTPNDGAFETLPSRLEAQDSPILSFTVIKQRYIAFTCMSGRMLVYDAAKGTIVAQRKDHSKYVVQVAKFEDEDGEGIWLATAGWDGKVLLYHTTISPNGTPELGDPVASIPQLTSPEALLFVRNPSDEKLHLIVTRRDSTFLYYYQVPSRSPTPPPLETSLAGRQNLAPHSNAWVAFTPSAIAPHPTDPTLIAVATSAVPHMKLLIVQLLFPSPDSDTAATESPRPSATSLLDAATDATHLTAASQARAALALQDREAAAITIHATTMAPQTQYSTPALAWRPDGSGVWVNSEDGVVRGIEASTGKVIGKLDGGHESGSKIRCLFAGYVGEGEEAREVLISGGFDQRLIAWWPEA